MSAQRSPVLIALTATAVVVSIIVLILYSDGCSESEEVNSSSNDTKPKSFDVINEGIEFNDLDSVDQVGAMLKFPDSKLLMEQIAQLANAEPGEAQFSALTKIIGANALTEEKRKRLQLLANSGELQLDEDNPFQVIGQLDRGKQIRWAMNLKNKARIFFDLTKQADGNWKVERLLLPKLSVETGKPLVGTVEEEDALSCAFSFVEHTLAQRFEDARGMVVGGSVLDASIAGLCILFEEGGYQLLADRPLRSSFQRDLAAGFIVNVISGDEQNAAEFSLIVQRETEQSEWRVHEVNLDKLIQDYATRLAGGDVYYTPLAKNPKGGQTLVIYFEFDQEGLTERNQRQLTIVSRLLKLDPNKNIVISGHTDGKGSADYNQSLSSKRATAVTSFLIELGVNQKQIRKEAYGMNQPRRPNTLDDGRDDPTGRRANRRTEIYLDF